MCNKDSTPERIKPFYTTQEPDQEIQLIEEEATLKQTIDDSDQLVEGTGTVRILQKWSPMGLYFEFPDINTHDFNYGEVEIVSNSFTTTGQIYSVLDNHIAGHIKSDIDIGTDHDLQDVTFHIPNYPDLYGGQSYHDKIDTQTVRWSEVVLEAEGFRIALQPIRDYLGLSQVARSSENIAITGVGQISRIDGKTFKKEKIKPLLNAIRIFLSFSFTNWTAPILVVGSNEVTPKSCEIWQNHSVDADSYLNGWLSSNRGHYLSTAFPGFMKLWANENWREPLELAVHWLIETSRRLGGIEAAIAVGQIPLEMLSWLVFVDDGKILESGEFGKLNAANQIQLLLAHCGIPSEPPTQLKSLSKLSKHLKPTTGPKLITNVRNAIIHPNESNRLAMSKWKNQFGIELEKLYWETNQLLKWYITLILLNRMGYSGQYVNRLIPFPIARYEDVPWNNSMEKAKV